MEFLRFGSSIPGAYWGCCAMCIIQDFSCDPDAEASIQLVCGDGGQPLGGKFLGMTNREVFNSRMRIGTFGLDDMPNHGFLAILTQDQVYGGYGRQWLAILKEHGFEFIRSVSNSVYAGQDLYDEGGWCSLCESNNCCDDDWCDYEEGGNTDMNVNYLFGLFRNIGNGKVTNPFEPPSAWTQLEGGVKGAHDFITAKQRAKITASQEKHHLAMWNKIGSAKMYTHDEVVAAGVEVTLAGQRSKFPQESEENRNRTLEAQKALQPVAAAPLPAFAASENTEVKVVK